MAFHEGLSTWSVTVTQRRAPEGWCDAQGHGSSVEDEAKSCLWCLVALEPQSSSSEAGGEE